MPACECLGPSLATEWNAWQDRRTGWAALAWIPIYYGREEDAEVKTTGIQYTRSSGYDMAKQKMYKFY